MLHLSTEVSVPYCDTMTYDSALPMRIELSFFRGSHEKTLAYHPDSDRERKEKTQRKKRKKESERDQLQSKVESLAKGLNKQHLHLFSNTKHLMRNH